MRKKNVLVCWIVLAFLLGIGTSIFAPPVHAAKTVLLRLVVPSPAGDYPLTYVNEQLAKKFNERAGGVYKIEVHAGGALAKLPEYFDAVRIGAVEMACAPWGFYTFMEPRLGLIEIPFLINNNASGAYAAKKYLPIYDQILQDKFNAKGLGLMNLAGVELISTKPIKTLEDWKGTMVGALSPLTAGMIKDLGGAPVTIIWTDMYESLQKKVIDATTTGTHSAVVMGMIDVCKYATLFFGLAAWNGFSINLDVWKKMPPEIQAILQEETIAVVDMMHGIMPKLDEDDMEAYKKKNVEISVLPGAERKRWIDATAATGEKQLAQFNDFGQKIKQIADEANKRYPYEARVIK